MARRENIEFVVKEFLCTSCGVCSGVCHSGAITLKLDDYGIYTPVVDEVLCDNCGICVKVCPGHGFDYPRHYRNIHGELPEHQALGACIDAYAGYVNDQAVLQRAQSGGFVSGLLLYCLDQGIIDGAVVTRPGRESPFSFETIVACDRETLLEATGSIYNPVPAAEAVGFLRKHDGKFAFVGTSCQIQGMRKAERQFKELSEKVVLYIGLHCLGVFTYHFHEYLLHKTGVARGDVSRFRLRDKAWRGWPCDMRLYDKSGNSHDLDARKSRLIPRPYFTNWRCQLCFDKANEFSDVSCGDCRIPEAVSVFKERAYDVRNGLSEFVVRTERARKIIDSAIADQRFTVIKRTSDELASSITVAGKKIGFNAFKAFCERFSISTPEYLCEFELADESSGAHPGRLKEYRFCLHYYVFFMLGRYRFFRFIVKKLSFRAMKKMNDRREKGVTFVVNRGVSKLKVNLYE